MVVAVPVSAVRVAAPAALGRLVVVDVVLPMAVVLVLVAAGGVLAFAVAVVVVEAVVVAAVAAVPMCTVIRVSAQDCGSYN